MANDRHTFATAGMTAWPVLLLRVYAGVVFAIHGWGKVGRGEDFVAGMTGFLQSNQEQAFAFYWSFIETAVLPQASLFASLVAWGELLLGIALVLGFATRYAALGGVFLMLNFWFVKGASFFTATNYDAVWLMIFVVLAFTPAGQIAGLDRQLSRRSALFR